VRSLIGDLGGSWEDRWEVSDGAFQVRSRS